jgi:hypothetical protein
MSGGFTPKLVTTTDPLSGQINVLASEHMMVKSVGVTLDAALWSADANGDKLVKNGHIVAKVVETGKYGPYLPGASNGQQDAETAGIVFHGGANLKDGDTLIGILMHGSVLEARVSGLDSAAATALKKRIIFQ